MPFDLFRGGLKFPDSDPLKICKTTASGVPSITDANLLIGLLMPALSVVMFLAGRTRRLTIARYVEQWLVAIATELVPWILRPLFDCYCLSILPVLLVLPILPVALSGHLKMLGGCDELL